MKASFPVAMFCLSFCSINVVAQIDVQTPSTSVLANAPFCADFDSIDDQKQVFLRHICRDSQGRTRTEIQPPQIQKAGFVTPPVIMIVDPVEQEMISIDSFHKTAKVKKTKIAYGAVSNHSVSAAIRTVTLRDGSKITEENLGQKEIDGVLAEGSRSTEVAPPGAEGNPHSDSQPLTVVDEVWRSPELRQIVLRKTTDSKAGTQVLRMTNIRREEPDPALFQIPKDYTVQQQP